MKILSENFCLIFCVHIYEIHMHTHDVCRYIPIHTHMCVYVYFYLFKLKNWIQLVDIQKLLKGGRNNFTDYSPWFKKITSIRKNYFQIWPGKMPPLYNIFRCHILFGGKEILHDWIHNGNLSSYMYNNSGSTGY